MFGRPPHNNGNPPPPQPAAEIARIQSGGLVQVIVTSVSPMTYYLFLNDKAVSQLDVESLSLDIEAPDGGDALVRATLARYIDSVAGGKTIQRTELFPCTLEIVALGRRVVVISPEADNLDNIVIQFGLFPDGSAREAHGVKALRILISEEILDAKLTWVDGEAEDLLPH